MHKTTLKEDAKIISKLDIYTVKWVCECGNTNYINIIGLENLLKIQDYPCVKCGLYLKFKVEKSVSNAKYGI